MKRKYFQTSQPVLLGGMLLLALIIGIIVPIFAGMVGDSYARLAALPALFILGGLMIFNRTLLLLIIVLLRSAGDIVLEATRATNASGFSPGLGGAINALIILIAFLFVVEKPQRLPRAVMVPWIILLAVSFYGLAVSPELGAALKIVLSLLSYCAMFICAFYIVRTPEDFRSLVKLVIWSSVLPALYGVVTVALNARGGLSGFRLQSTFGHANILAFYLTLVLSMGLYVLKSPEFRLTQLKRIGLMSWMFFLMGLLLLTQTRSAWIACFLMFFLYGTLFERRYLLYLMVLPLIALMIPSVHERIAQLDSGNTVETYAKLNSFAWRVLLWKSGLHWMSPSHYLQGYGVESFLHYSVVFFPLAGGVPWGAHSVYVQWFFDTGLIGIAAYFFVFYAVIRMLAKLYPADKLAACMLIFIAVEHLIVSASDNVLAYLAFNWYFWLLCGAGCALYYNSDAYKAEQERRRQKRLPGYRLPATTRAR
ncbi:O-antigen ligase family protein [Herbaspirillum chlorophenolicum]|uniref:O-antigen ligase family protein n=1 Tax=Herbaspirillum chlorophenolicum TaxID=211589 RepID=A0ABW8EUI3_9BURK